MHLHTHLAVQAVQLLLNITLGEVAEVLITGVTAVCTMVTHHGVRNLPEAISALKRRWKTCPLRQLTGSDISSSRPARALLITGKRLVRVVAVRTACAGNLEGHCPLARRLQRQLCCVVGLLTPLLPSVHFTKVYCHAPLFARAAKESVAIPFPGP